MIKKALFSAALLWSMSASAQLDSGYYLGASLGKLDYGDNAFGRSISDSTNFNRIYGGFRFDDIWALEANYGQSGLLEWRESAFLPGTGTYSADVAANWDIFQVRGIAHLKKFYGGVAYWRANIDFDVLLTDPVSGRSIFSTSDDDTGYSFIVGGEWELDEWAIRGEYEYFDTDSGVDISILSFGAHLKF